ncbi:hypothetical protein ABK040_008160 [Willaertia magna]
MLRSICSKKLAASLAQDGLKMKASSKKNPLVSVFVYDGLLNNKRHFSIQQQQLNNNTETTQEEEEMKPIVTHSPKKKYINKILNKPLEKPLQLWFNSEKWTSDEKKRVEYIARLLLKFQYKNLNEFIELNPKQKSALDLVEEVAVRDDKLLQKLFEEERKQTLQKAEEELTTKLNLTEERKEQLKEVLEITPIAALKKIKNRGLSFRTILSFPKNLIPKSQKEAQLAQLKLTEMLINERGWKLVGWKIGATQPKAQSRLQIEEPFLGPIFEHQLLKNPQKIKVEEISNFGPMAEVEFAFYFGKDLVARREPYTKEELLDALSGVSGAIEIIGTRVDNVENQGGVLSRIADLGGHINLIIPEKPSTFDIKDSDKLAQESVELLMSDKSEAKGNGNYVHNGQFNPADTIGPLDTCLQCVNMLTSVYGVDINAGQIISSGTMTGKSRELEKGDVIKAHFNNPIFEPIVFKYDN